MTEHNPQLRRDQTGKKKNKKWMREAVKRKIFGMPYGFH